MRKNIYYSFIITCLFWGRHFLVISQPQNAFDYGQTIKDFIFVCIYFFLTVLSIYLAFWTVGRFSPNKYKKVVFTTLYISILPLLDFILISVFPIDSIVQWGIGRYVYAFVIFAYVPIIILVSFKYRIEKYGEKIAVMLTCICVLIIYYAVPQSFSKNVVENTFISEEKTSVHLIIFDGMSYDVLNDPDLKHLFPNLNRLLSNDSYVFETAYSPGPMTYASIPKILTGVEYDTFRKGKNFRFLIKKYEDNNYRDLPIDSSLFKMTKSYGYNNVLIGWSFSYCNIFGKYLSYGKTFPHYKRLGYLLPYPFKIFLYMSHRQQRNNSLNMFNEYFSKIDSSPPNTFFFVHFPIPHYPFVFDTNGFVNQYWEWIFKGGKVKSYEKYVKQLMFVDKKVGEIVQKLKDKNLYDRSLIIITADHNALNFEPVMVPLIIKTPFQKKHYIIRDNVYTINLNKFFFKFFETNIVDIDELK